MTTQTKNPVFNSKAPLQFLVFVLLLFFANGYLAQAQYYESLPAATKRANVIVEGYFTGKEFSYVRRIINKAKKIHRVEVIRLLDFKVDKVIKGNLSSYTLKIVSEQDKDFTDPKTGEFFPVQDKSHKVFPIKIVKDLEKETFVLFLSSQYEYEILREDSILGSTPYYFVNKKINFDSSRLQLGHYSTPWRSFQERYLGEFYDSLALYTGAPFIDLDTAKTALHRRIQKESRFLTSKYTVYGPVREGSNPYEADSIKEIIKSRLIPKEELKKKVNKSRSFRVSNTGTLFFALLDEKIVHQPGGDYYEFEINLRTDAPGRYVEYIDLQLDFNRTTFGQNPILEREFSEYINNNFSENFVRYYHSNRGNRQIEFYIANENNTGRYLIPTTLVSCGKFRIKIIQSGPADISIVPTTAPGLQSFVLSPTFNVDNINNFATIFQNYDMDDAIINLPYISSFSPSTISAGTNSTLTLNGWFGAVSNNSTVGFINGEGEPDVYRLPANSNFITNRSVSQIQVRIPSDFQSGSLKVIPGSGRISVYTDFGTNSGTLKTSDSREFVNVNYVHRNTSLNGNPVRLGNVRPLTNNLPQGETDKFVFYLHTNIAGNEQAVLAIKAALTEWSCKTNINWALASLSTEESNIPLIENRNDGKSVISLQAPLDDRLGATFNHPRAATNLSYGFSTYPDIQIINRDLDFSIPNGSTYKVILHELGHALNLDHTRPNPNTGEFNVMNFQNSSSVNGITASDEAGGDAVMAYTAQALPSTVSVTLPTGTINVQPVGTTTDGCSNVSTNTPLMINSLDLSCYCVPTASLKPRFEINISGGTPPYNVYYEELAANDVELDNTGFLNPTVVSSSGNNQVAYKVIVIDNASQPNITTKVFERQLITSGPFIYVRDFEGDNGLPHSQQLAGSIYQSPDIWNRINRSVDLNSNSILDNQQPIYKGPIPATNDPNELSINQPPYTALGSLNQSFNNARFNWMHARVWNKGCNANNSGDHKVHLYWTKGSTNELWKNTWTNFLNTTNNQYENFVYDAVIAPDQNRYPYPERTYPSSIPPSNVYMAGAELNNIEDNTSVGAKLFNQTEISLPSIAPGQFAVVQHPWFTPRWQNYNVSGFGQYDGVNGNRVSTCMLVRVVPTNGTIGDENLVTTPISTPVLAYSKIATRNTFTNNPNTSLPNIRNNDPERLRGDWVDIGNVRNEPSVINLTFKNTGIFGKNLKNLNWGSLIKFIIYFRGDIYTRWLQSGGNGTGFTRVDNKFALIINANSDVSIEGIVLNANDTRVPIMVHSELLTDETLPENLQLNFQLGQFEINKLEWGSFNNFIFNLPATENDQKNTENYYLTFDGNNDFAYANPIEPYTQLNNFTLEAKVSLSQVRSLGNYIIMSNFDNSSGNGYKWGVISQANGLYTMYLETQYFTYYSQPISITCNYLSLVFDNNEIAFFHDGIEFYRKNVANATILSSNEKITIGNEPTLSPNRFFRGAIDEVRIWSQTLTGEQMISTYLNNQLTGNEEGLIAYWNFEEGHGQVSDDISIFNNPMILGEGNEFDISDPNWKSEKCEELLEALNNLNLEGGQQNRFNVSAEDYLIYPNPTLGIISINTLYPNASNSIQSVEILNLQGQPLRSKIPLTETWEITFDISDLLSGTYLVKITSNSQVKTSLIIKN